MSEKNDHTTPGAGVSRETPKPETPTPPQRNKPSSFYIYLAVLFGAAFLMLLLAYFVQRRNNDTALSDLRSTTAASQEELAEDIQRLEKENLTLTLEKLTLEGQLQEEQARGAALEEKSARYQADYYRMTAWYRQSNLLYCMERCRDTGEWLLMGEIVQMSDILFSRRSPGFSDQYAIPAQEERYLELREALFENSGFMVMERRPGPDGADTESPMIEDGAFREEVRSTVSSLHAIVRDYPVDPLYAARLIALDFAPNSGRTEVLHSGVFQASTVEWFEEIKADLTAQGYLIENEDGSVSLCEKT